ncbi:DUF362 domain-containing protein [Microbacter margulisiae]|uniref:Uncharacterized protein (DUF362 family)/ferredoxin n=1 Tax=Microbacter margulisiae TaxID=1350067 RepID=A0A7W5H1B7_9PORP|nr:DUF362 domain-containing protein [Microbacter margulisiae]MBB3186469.1 uncharacterized protein (DUF362 family)/ferredoxin [Microbacter margulisiae]
MKSRVALVRCDSYDIEEVKMAVSRGIQLIGGAKCFVKTGEKIVLKVNLLVGDTPEKCVTTHPSVFKAVAETFANEGVIIQYGDSPGHGSPHAAAKKAGIADVAEDLLIDLAEFKEGREIFFEQGKQNKKFFIANGVLDADGLISLPKMKTHALERFTGSIKNQFGTVVGMRKSEFHVKLPNAIDFARMLVDLNNYIKPRLYIMDGIIAMEGNGPRGGTPRPMNVLLFSTDPVALDATACRLINLNPAYVPTTIMGYQAGSGTYLQEEIELVGDDLKSFVCPDFVVDRTPVKPAKKNSVLLFVNNRLIPKPVILTEKCTQCGTCVNSCPVEGKAVYWDHNDRTKAPVYDYKKCIRCYCCQEMCPENAIVLQTPIIRKLGNFL